MAFTPPPSRTPTSIERLTIILSDRDPGGQSAHYELVVLDQNGAPMQFAQDKGNLVPHLTAQEITQLQNFLATLRTRAENAILV